MKTIQQENKVNPNVLQVTTHARTHAEEWKTEAAVNKADHSYF